MKLLIYSLFVSVFIPLITYSIEPSDPKHYCDRFVVSPELEECKKITLDKNLDWYMSSVCQQLEEDSSFLKCLKDNVGHQFQPKALELCLQVKEDEKLGCLQNIRNKVYSVKALNHCQKIMDSSQWPSCLQKSGEKRQPSSFFQ